MVGGLVQRILQRTKCKYIMSVYSFSSLAITISKMLDSHAGRHSFDSTAGRYFALHRSPRFQRHRGEKGPDVELHPYASADSIGWIEQ